MYANSRGAVRTNLLQILILLHYKYKDDPNDADLRIDKLEAQIQLLVENSHPAKEFVTCDCCKNKLKEKSGK